MRRGRSLLRGCPTRSGGGDVGGHCDHHGGSEELAGRHSDGLSLSKLECRPHPVDDGIELGIGGGEDPVDIRGRDERIRYGQGARSRAPEAADLVGVVRKVRGGGRRSDGGRWGG